MDNISITNFKKADIILFSVQVLLIFIVVCVSLINLSLQIGNMNLWTILLTSLMGYIMPNPKIKVVNGQVEIDKSDK